MWDKDLYRFRDPRGRVLGEMFAGLPDLRMGGSMPEFRLTLARRNGVRPEDITINHVRNWQPSPSLASMN